MISVANFKPQDSSMLSENVVSAATVFFSFFFLHTCAGAALPTVPAATALCLRRFQWGDQRPCGPSATSCGKCHTMSIKKCVSLPHCTSSRKFCASSYKLTCWRLANLYACYRLCYVCVCVCVFFNKICLNHNIIFYSSQREMKVSVRSHTLKHNQKLNCT